MRAIGLGLLLAGCATAPRALPEDVQARVRDVLAEAGPKWGVAYEDLETGERWEWNAEEQFHAASTMKVLVLVKVMQDVHDGKYRLDDEVAVTDTFTSFVDGKPFKVEANVGPMRAAVGKTMTVRALVEYMITVSDNLATNVLIRQAGEAKAINECAARYGVTKCNVLRYIQDVAAFEAGYSSKAQARDFCALMGRIWRGEVVSRAACDEMLSVMSRLRGRAFLGTSLPEGTRVAHKTGAITKVRNDVGLVYREGRAPVVMVFLSGELASDRKGEAAIAEAAKTLYEHARR